VGDMTTKPARDLPGVERRELRFNRLYAEHVRSVLAYAVRRVADEQDAADVVAETFLVAWRRLDEVPAGGDACLWLYGVARRVLANQHRAGRRRQRLADRLGRDLVPALQTAAGPVAEAQPIRAALSRLESRDQEILRLAAWEELTPSAIACVLGITPIAARSRLHRARNRLRAALRQETEVGGFNPLSVQETA
jgi:RNA polymerase sigma factor (sigma-70 family)